MTERVNRKNVLFLTMLFTYQILFYTFKLAGDHSNDDKVKTFVFQDEGHTLGNVLRSIIAH